MLMVRELTDEEIKQVCHNEMLAISDYEAIQLARALFEAARVQQTER
jgi:hypothetical protein